MDPSHAEELPKPLDPPIGWPLCYRTDKEGITDYNTFVNEWNTWASQDPNEDKDKWGEALGFIHYESKRHSFCHKVAQAATEELKGEPRYENHSRAARALQGWYPRSLVLNGILPYNQDGASFDAAEFKLLRSKIPFPTSAFPRLSWTLFFWSDPEGAATSLRRDEWIDVKTAIETDLERCPFVHSNTIQYLCLDPLVVEERRELVPGQLPPIPKALRHPSGQSTT
ncbi:hypothetical protein FPHYL_7507 [Fusarium phyllophilum]|uniref:Uncharacterized protein n=1 Tax=Fusarium phyllophilum TaxID=47803 RepID=A0A8H5JQ19_9HYPO|nr:hypothetical protein FPHYL_7507 [Fusarium phyllophilum]